APGSSRRTVGPEGPGSTHALVILSLPRWSQTSAAVALSTGSSGDGCVDGARGTALAASRGSVLVGAARLQATIIADAVAKESKRPRVRKRILSSTTCGCRTKARPESLRRVLLGAKRCLA